MKKSANRNLIEVSAFLFILMEDLRKIDHYDDEQTWFSVDILDSKINVQTEFPCTIMCKGFALNRMHRYTVFARIHGFRLLTHSAECDAWHAHQRICLNRVNISLRALVLPLVRQINAKSTATADIPILKILEHSAIINMKSRSWQREHEHQ